MVCRVCVGVLRRARDGVVLNVDEAAIALSARGDDLVDLCASAARVRDAGLESAGRRGPHGVLPVTYSRKVFIPMARLCRDTCHYCTFVTVPGRLRAQGQGSYMEPQEIVEVASRGGLVARRRCSRLRETGEDGEEPGGDTAVLARLAPYRSRWPSAPRPSISGPICCTYTSSTPASRYLRSCAACLSGSGPDATDSATAGRRPSVFVSRLAPAPIPGCARPPDQAVRQSLTRLS